MNRICVPFILALVTLTASLAVPKGGHETPTAVRVLDPSGQGISGVVLLVNPGDVHKSVAAITNGDGNATVPRLGCEICVITAMDPRHLFISRTTQFQGDVGFFTIVLPIRPVIDTVGQRGSISVTVEVRSPNDSPLSNHAVLVRPKTATMEKNWFYIDKTDRAGHLTIQCVPGDYILASWVHGAFLEATLHLAIALKQECRERQLDCLITAAAHSAPRGTIVVRLTGLSSTP